MQRLSLPSPSVQGSAPNLHLQELTRFYAQQLLQPDRGVAESRLELLKANISSTEVTSTAAIAFLAIALSFHEDHLKLWQKLNQTATAWQVPLDRLGVFAVGFAIAEALQERLNPRLLIPQLATALESFSDNRDSAIVDQLRQVQILLKQPVGLDMAQKCLLETLPRDSTTPIALAFYCFLSTPDDFRLAVQRAARLGYQTEAICALTGALSGAHNSTFSIPVEWFLAIEAENLASGRGSTQTEILQLANHLLANWAGVYRSFEVSHLGENAAVAAPQVIRKLES